MTVPAIRVNSASAPFGRRSLRSLAPDHGHPGRKIDRARRRRVGWPLEPDNSRFRQCGANSPASSRLAAMIVPELEAARNQRRSQALIWNSDAAFVAFRAHGVQ